MDYISTPKPAVERHDTEPSRAASPAQDSDSSAVAAGVLHGRMLQVSRLATIGEMAAGVAHELNQPLTAIANYAQACDRLLGRPDANLEDVRSALREIASEAVRAGDILHRLRSLARSRSMQRDRPRSMQPSKGSVISSWRRPEYTAHASNSSSPRACRTYRSTWPKSST